MRDQFEQYIATVTEGELKLLSNIFSTTRRNAFWVVDVRRTLRNVRSSLKANIG